MITVVDVKALYESILLWSHARAQWWRVTRCFQRRARWGRLWRRQLLLALPSFSSSLMIKASSITAVQTIPSPDCECDAEETRTFDRRVIPRGAPLSPARHPPQWHLRDARARSRDGPRRHLLPRVCRRADLLPVAHEHTLSALLAQPQVRAGGCLRACCARAGAACVLTEAG